MLLQLGESTEAAKAEVPGHEPESKTNVIFDSMKGRQEVDIDCRRRQQPYCEVLVWFCLVLTGHRSQLSKVGDGIQAIVHILSKCSTLNLGLFLHI